MKDFTEQECRAGKVFELIEALDTALDNVIPCEELKDLRSLLEYVKHRIRIPYNQYHQTVHVIISGKKVGA